MSHPAFQASIAMIAALRPVKKWGCFHGARTGIAFGLITALALAAESPASASSSTWSGTTGNWTDSTWSNGVPGGSGTNSSLDVATFNTSGGGTITVDSSRNVKGITFDTNAGAFTLSGGSLVLTSASTVQIASTVSSTGKTETVNTPITLEGSSTFANNGTTSDVLSFGSLSTITSAATTGTTTLTLSGTNTGANTVGGIIGNGAMTNVVAVTKSGTGTWILSGANTYTGTTTINDGTLKLGANNTLATTSTVAVNETTAGNTAKLDLNGFNQTIGVLMLGASGGNTNTNNVVGTGTLTMSGTGTLTFTGGSAGALGSTISVTTLDLGGSTHVFQINHSTIDGINPDLTVSSAIQNGGINKTGAGILLLTGTNTYSGTTSDQGNGTLLVGNASALGTSNLAISAGSTISSSSSLAYNLGNTVSVANTGGGTFGISGSGDLTFGAFTDGTTQTNATVVVNNANTTFSGLTSAATSGGTFVKQGTGAFIVAGNSSLINTTYDIQGGMLAVTGTMALNNIELDGGVVGLNGSYTKSLGTNTGGFFHWNSGASGGFAAYGTNATWGNAANNLSVNIANNSVPQVFGATNFISSGATLILGNASSNGTVTLVNGLDLANATQTIQVDHGVTNTANGYDAKLAGAITDGGLAKTGLGNLALSNATGNTYAGGTTVTAGTLTAANTSGSATGSGAVTVGTGSANSGTLAGKGIITSSGVTIKGGGSLASGDRSQVSGTGLSSVGGMTLNNTPVTIGSGTGTANLTFALGSGTSGINGGTASGRYDFSNPNNNTTYLKLTGSSSINFAGTTSITLVDLTNTTGTNGSLTLRLSSPYLLINAGSNANYLNLVINSGTAANPIYSLSQNDATVNGYVVGVYTGGAVDAEDATPILIAQFGADGVTPLTPEIGGLYGAPALYLDGGNLEVVPEPGTWAMMLGGLACLVVVMKARRKNG